MVNVVIMLLFVGMVTVVVSTVTVVKLQNTVVLVVKVNLEIAIKQNNFIILLSFVILLL